KPQANNPDIDSITVAMKVLTINSMKQKTSNASRLDVIETKMKEITRIVKQLVDKQTIVGCSNDRNQNFTRDSKYQRQSSNNQRCFNCQQEGHISCNCPNRIAQNCPEQRDVINENRNTNICYFEIINISLNLGIECLKVEMAKGEPIFNVR
ncbi:6691_t:CDS:1, partial [Dentiscutata heterogama]